MNFIVLFSINWLDSMFPGISVLTTINVTIFLIMQILSLETEIQILKLTVRYVVENRFHLVQCRL